MTGSFVIGLRMPLGAQRFVMRSARASMLGFVLLLGAWAAVNCNDCGNIQDTREANP